MLNEGRKEDAYKKFKRAIDIEKNLVSNYLDTETATLYGFLISDPFMQQTNFKYLDDLVDVYYSKWTGLWDDFAPLNRAIASIYITRTRTEHQKIINALKFFDANNQKYRYPEFSKYKKNDFFDFLAETEELNKKFDEKKAKKDVYKIFEDEKLLILKPKSYEGSCLYGAGTKWCTASKQSPEHWNNYSAAGDLYYLITKGVPQSNRYYKIALFIEDNADEQWWDALDERLNENNIDLLTSAYGPALSKIREHYKTLDKNQIVRLDCIFSSDRKISRKITVNDIDILYLSKYKDSIIDVALFDLEISMQVKGKKINLGFYTLKIDGIFTKEFCTLSTSILENEIPNIDKLSLSSLDTFRIPLSTKNISCEDIFNNYFFIFTKYLNLILLQSPVAKNLLNNDDTILITSSDRGYRFTNRNKGLIKKFTDWLQKNKKSTKADFLIDSGMIQKKGDVFYSTSSKTPIEIRGFYSSFFSSVSNAGISRNIREGNKSYIVKGPNFDKFMKGAKIVYI